MSIDVYQIVTDRIIAALEAGTAPWVQPWIGRGGALKHRDGQPYSILNQLLLGREGEWLSYKEAQACGGHVKQGAKGKIVVFYKLLKCEDGIDANGEAAFKTIPLLKYYTVFHIDDCEGVKPKWTDKSFGTQTIDDAQNIFDDYKTRCHVSTLHETKNRAFYRPSEHAINLPDIDQFKSAEEYYSTAFHEAVHSTGHHTLLNRFPIDAMPAAFGSESYSKEELVAEIGACTLLNRLGIETAGTFRNNAAYIKGWLYALKNEKKLIVSAACKAQKAVELILNEKISEE